MGWGAPEGWKTRQGDVALRGKAEERRRLLPVRGRQGRMMLPEERKLEHASTGRVVKVYF